MISGTQSRYSPSNIFNLVPFNPSPQRKCSSLFFIAEVCRNWRIQCYWDCVTRHIGPELSWAAAAEISARAWNLICWWKNKDWIEASQKTFRYTSNIDCFCVTIWHKNFEATRHADWIRLVVSWGWQNLFHCGDDQRLQMKGLVSWEAARSGTPCESMESCWGLSVHWNPAWLGER